MQSYRPIISSLRMIKMTEFRAFMMQRDDEDSEIALVMSKETTVVFTLSMLPLSISYF